MADSGEKYKTGGRQVFYTATSNVDEGITLAQYKVNGTALNVLKKVDTWNELASTSKYKIGGSTISNVAAPGTMPKYYSALDTYSGYSVTDDMTITVSRTDTQLTITRGTTGSVITKTTSDFRNGVIPKRLLVELQAAGGGGGAGGDGTTGGCGGGGGGFWAGIVTFPNNNSSFTITLGHPGDYTTVSESTKQSHDSSITVNDTLSVIVGSGWNGGRQAGGSGTPGAGGTINIVTSAYIYTLASVAGGRGGKNNYVWAGAADGEAGESVSAKTISCTTGSYGNYNTHAYSAKSGGAGSAGVYIVFGGISGGGGGGACVYSNGGPAKQGDDAQPTPSYGGGGGGGSSAAGGYRAVARGGFPFYAIFY